MTNARDLSDRLATLLRREHGALADFLIELAAFDGQLAWRDLGYPSLWVYLREELGLSKGAAHYRIVAARLVRRHPAVLEALRDGSLCMSTLCALDKVLTGDNEAEVLPRYLHRSKAEARAITAELRPEPAPGRTVLTVVPASAPSRVEAPPRIATRACAAPVHPGEPLALTPAPRLAAPSSPTATPAPPAPPPAPPRAEVVPLDADLRRMHVTVSKQLLDKLDAARDALSHSMPGASIEEILEKGLDLILERQAKRRGQSDRPLARPRPSSDPEHVPAHVRAAVWTRDGGRCQAKLPSGRTCGSTFQVELDHIRERALDGPNTVDNLRLACRPHNLDAARRTFGDEWMDRFCGPFRHGPGR